MAMDIRDHDAVPDQRILAEDEAEDVLEKYDADRQDLPKIERTDAALKQMEPEVGDIVEVRRDSPTAGKTTYYRLVKEPE